MSFPAHTAELGRILITSVPWSSDTDAVPDIQVSLECTQNCSEFDSQYGSALWRSPLFSPSNPSVAPTPYQREYMHPTFRAAGLGNGILIHVLLVSTKYNKDCVESTVQFCRCVLQQSRIVYSLVSLSLAIMSART